MDQHKNHIMPLLAAAAALSVVAFSSIGVAAITGHLPIAQSSLNPFSALLGKARDSAATTVASPTKATHLGLTRGAGEPQRASRPLDFRPGERIPRQNADCASCGVVDSIRARQKKREGFEETPSGTTFVSHLTEIEAATLVSFVVTVRMEDGTIRTIHENQQPPFSIGERVKLVNGAVIPLG